METPSTCDAAWVRTSSAVAGVRGYLAVSGGIAVDPVLGSRSTDLLSGLGPAPLADGAVLPLGRPGALPARVDVAPQPAPPGELLLGVSPGPRDGLWHQLQHPEWHGVRLADLAFPLFLFAVVLGWWAHHTIRKKLIS